MTTAQTMRRFAACPASRMGRFAADGQGRPFRASVRSDSPFSRPSAWSSLLSLSSAGSADRGCGPRQPARAQAALRARIAPALRHCAAHHSAPRGSLPTRCRKLSSRSGRTQTVFLGAGRGRRPWLTGIVRFRALDAVRKLGREVLSGDPGLGDEPVEPDVLAGIDARAAGRSAAPLPAIADDNQRRCVVLAFVDGFSHAEIAGRLAAPLGSVKSWVRRGLIALKGCLEA